MDSKETIKSTDWLVRNAIYCWMHYYKESRPELAVLYQHLLDELPNFDPPETPPPRPRRAKRQRKTQTSTIEAA